MKRFFARIQYKGTNYAGWQYQPNALTVQEVLETNLSKVLRVETKIVGCGRTDSGVHASDYVFHFDMQYHDIKALKFKLNRMLPNAIVICDIYEVNPKAHARFDAVSRSYEYHINRIKNPFANGLSYYKPQVFDSEIALLRETASIMPVFEDFFTFCKSNTDVKTTLCDIQRCEWEISDDKMVFYVTANRFLRGMIRLMVGCCINVANGTVELAEVKNALEEKRRLRKDLSAPAHGLFLSKIVYPKAIHIEEKPS